MCLALRKGSGGGPVISCQAEIWSHMNGNSAKRKGQWKQFLEQLEIFVVVDTSSKMNSEVPAEQNFR